MYIYSVFILFIYIYIENMEFTVDTITQTLSPKFTQLITSSLLQPHTLHIIANLLQKIICIYYNKQQYDTINNLIQSYIDYVLTHDDISKQGNIYIIYITYVI